YRAVATDLVAGPHPGWLPAFWVARSTARRLGVRSAHRAVTPGPVRPRQHQLPQLHVACAESPGTQHQVIAPHTVEALAVPGGEFRPGQLKVVLPGHQGGIVIRAEIVPVLDDQQSFAGVAELSC